METNKRIGDYEVLEELGSGGMGRVYRVRNVLSDRIEAMKVLLPDLVGRQDLAARFLREIKLLAALDHPNIAELRTALSADNQLVMIMEYVEGESLASRLRHGAIPRSQALTYIDQVLDALSYAHGRQVIHRDIKPGNMMLTPEGVVKLMDFGIARSRNDQTLTAAGTTTGSLSYMSPEQVNGEPTDARSDLYSVGISLYEMVTGQRPFQADSDFAVMIAHLKEQPRPPIELQPALGAELNDIILTAIAKSPDRRFQSAQEFRDRLGQVPSEATVARATVAGVTTRPLNVPVTGSPSFATADSASTFTSDRAPVEERAPSIPVVPPPAPGIPTIPPVPVATTRPGHPALYVALGGVLVLGALVAAGLYIGRAAAEPTETLNVPSVPESATPAPSTPAEPAPAASAAPTAPAETPAPTTPAASVPSTTAAASPTVSTPAAPVQKETASDPAITAADSGRTAPLNRRGAGGTMQPRVGAGLRRDGPPNRAGGEPGAGMSRSLSPESTATQPAPAQPAPAPDSAAFDELERELDQLSTRVSAVNQSLASLQQQQARQGLGLRGDMVARQQSMNINLARAQEALAQRALARAERAKSQAASDVEALERFLGR